ncbi:MAG TPA: hypothetical protein VF414_03220, partial [Thermoanaerobaculia bacterium]
RPHPRDLKKDEIEVKRVAQLSSQVVSLAYLSDYQTSAGRMERIFAGGEDGTVVAWQKDRDAAGFVSLWSTVEEGAVAAIHVLAYGPPGPGQEPRVLVVTRAGRCTVLDDRSDLDAPAGDRPRWQPQRPHFPGKRLRRSPLGGTAFASHLLCRLPSGEPVWDEETGRYAALLIASEQGRIRLASLHYPQSPQRREQYDRTVGLWWQIAGLKGRRDRLRLVDAAYQAAPLLPLILVRWVLAPEGRRRGVQVPPVPKREDAWQMPRYLRPLLDLREAWERRDAEQAAEALKKLLLHAWQLDDLALFQQICAVTLQRANFAICKAAGRSGGGEADEKLCDLYLAVFEVIERSLQRWLGVPDQETRARIIVAKNLVDGDTFLRVLRRAEQELKLVEGNPGKKGPFRRILDKRIEGVRQLVFKQDPLLSVETFRALNLSLMRLCRRLIGSPRKNGRQAEVSWSVFASYFEALTYAAARTFHSRLDLNDSLAHEYCRTFALAVCACPSAAIRIANRMTETQLISDPGSDQDLSRRVIRQFDVLAQIGIGVPSEAARLFEMASCPPKEKLNPVEEAMEELGFKQEELKRLDRPDDPVVIQTFGTENAEDLHCLFRLYQVVDWFTDLGKRLSTDAKGLDLTKDRLAWLHGRLRESEKGPLQRLFSHSVRFWTQAIEKLGRLAQDAPSEDTIRPKMILCSRDLAAWAGKEIDVLHNSYRDLEIFQPEYPIYREVLARLERAAHAFPLSSAVQKNLVVSVFGHHLLEDLDEHVFELEELAQNLDPLLVWQFRDRHRAPRSLDGRQGASQDGPAAKRFAEYLLRRANYAESIPKNLRALYGILESAPRDHDRYPIRQLFNPLGWEPEGDLPGAQIRAQEFQFLSLSLAELESNHQKHSGLTPSQRRRYAPRFRCLAEDPLSLSVSFRFRWDDTNAGRLERLRLEGLQEPLPPREDRAVASTGAGLYLANLAASVVNWQLQLSRIDRYAKLGICTFELRREGPEP